MIETVLVDCNLVDNQSLRYSGPILESKGMCDFSGKGQNIWKVGQKCTKFENILKEDRWLCEIIAHSKLLE